MKSRFILYISIILILLLLNCQKAGAVKMEFKTKNLKNGAKVKYLIRESIPIAYLTVLIPASSLDEKKISQAYLTAQMLTHGTKKRSARQIEDEIDFLAITIEKKVTHDYTMLTLSTTKRNLKSAIELFFDILKNPTFPEDEFRKEISILQKSLRQLEEDPSHLATKYMLKDLFGKHPYGRVVEGEPDKLSELTREDLVEFYQKFYKPDSMIFSIVGSIDKNDLEEISREIENWEGKSIKRELQLPQPSDRDKPCEIIIKRDDLTQSTILIGFVGISRKDPKFYAFSVMNYILGGGGLTSRLAKEVREERGLAYSVYSTFSPYLFPGPFYVEVKTKAENTKRVIELILEELNKISKHGVTDEELEEAKAFLIGSFPLRFDTMKKIAEFLPLLDFYELGDEYFSKYPEYINGIKSVDILNVSSNVLRQNHVTVIVGPQLK